MNEIKLTSTYYLPEVISALVQEGYTLEVKQGRAEDEIIIRWASADRKPEPQSGYCNECKWYGDKQVCGRCRSRNLYAPKTEPQTYVINPQEPTNDDKCFECDDFFTCGGQCNKIETEPQTEETQDGFYDEYYRDHEDFYEPQTEREGE